MRSQYVGRRTVLERCTKEDIAMKRAPLLFPRVFDDSETAESYAASASKRGRQVE
jgi:hypothetical protein